MRAKKFLVGFVLAVVALSISANSVFAENTVIYNNIPKPLPGNLVSLAFEATSTYEFGGLVSFAGSDREDPTVTVTMSSWGCQTGHWYSNDCVTAPKATFSHPITLNIYKVNTNYSPGARIAKITKTFAIPFRPSASSKCTGADAGKWYDKGSKTCFNGYATNISFKLRNITLPQTVIISVAYNTTHYGYAPIGQSAACYTSSSGCGYDSLNVGVTAPPTVGSDPLPDDAYVNAATGYGYCDNGTSGVNVFRRDAGCWTGYQPAFRVSLADD